MNKNKNYREWLLSYMRRNKQMPEKLVGLWMRKKFHIRRDYSIAVIRKIVKNSKQLQYAYFGSLRVLFYGDKILKPHFSQSPYHKPQLGRLGLWEAKQW